MDDKHPPTSPAYFAHAALVIVAALPLVWQIPVGLNIVITAALCVYVGCWRSVKPLPPIDSMTRKVIFPDLQTHAEHSPILCWLYLSCQEGVSDLVCAATCQSAGSDSGRYWLCAGCSEVSIDRECRIAWSFCGLQASSKGTYQQNFDPVFRGAGVPGLRSHSAALRQQTGFSRYKRQKLHTEESQSAILFKGVLFCQSHQLQQRLGQLRELNQHRVWASLWPLSSSLCAGCRNQLICRQQFQNCFVFC